MLCNFYFTKGNGFFESSSIETVKFRKVRNKIIDLKNNKTSLYKTETLYQEIIKMKNAADRNRTGTGITTHRILSPGRLPVPPLRQEMLKRFLRKAYVLCTVFSTSHQWAEVDSNHRSKLQQIYSLSPLATRESTHFVSRQYLFIS